MLAVNSLDTFRRFAANTLFDGIEPEVLEDIRDEMKTLRLREGEVVFNEGDPGDVLYLVGEGSIKISKAGRGGKQETLGFIEPGNFFGEMALFDGQPRSAKATAASSALVATVNEQTFQHILSLAPSRLHMNFLRCVSERLRHVNSHFISEVMRSERLSLVGSMANSIIHDLKNPICIIRCSADLIASETTDSRVRELTTMIDGAVNGMLVMTQELLDYAKGQTTLDKQRVSIWRLLDELSQETLRLLPGQNIQFVKRVRYEGDIEVDLPRFLRMMGNLIKNASEAMRGGGILTMTTDLVQGHVLIRISDTGCGIPPDIMPKLFEPFVTHGKSHGTGLGMAIAKSVVEAHGGRISVGSVVGNGTTVEIRLPAPV